MESTRNTLIAGILTNKIIKKLNVGNEMYPVVLIGITQIIDYMSGYTFNKLKFSKLLKSLNILNQKKGTIINWVKPSFDPTADSAARFFFDSGDSAGADADAFVHPR